jgi:hypothetical protein
MVQDLGSRVLNLGVRAFGFRAREVLGFKY